MKTKLTFKTAVKVLCVLTALNSVAVIAQANQSLVSQSVNQVGDFLNDTTVTANVKNAILGDNHSQVSSLSVNTERGEVTISGFVSSLSEKSHLHSVVLKVAGVKHLNDQLRVRRAKQSSVRAYASDVATTSEAIMRLFADKKITTRGLHVATRHSEVFLTGTIPTQSEKQQAEQLVKEISGVHKVKNELKVTD